VSNGASDSDRGQNPEQLSWEVNQGAGKCDAEKSTAKKCISEGSKFQSRIESQDSHSEKLSSILRDQCSLKFNGHMLSKEWLSFVQILLRHTVYTYIFHPNDSLG
jgi:hypothetical protein